MHLECPLRRIIGVTQDANPKHGIASQLHPHSLQHYSKHNLSYDAFPILILFLHSELGYFFTNTSDVPLMAHHSRCTVIVRTKAMARPKPPPSEYARFIQKNTKRPPPAGPHPSFFSVVLATVLP